jgi:hypothetical protein
LQIQLNLGQQANAMAGQFGFRYQSGQRQGKLDFDINESGKGDSSTTDPFTGHSRILGRTKGPSGLDANKEEKYEQ